MEHRRPTLRDVARRSGVSPATVSFVLNDAPGQTIPLGTRERVRTAAVELGYTPHRLARALREGRSRILVLEVEAARGGGSLKSFVQGMREELGAHGYSLVLNTDGASSAELLEGLHPHAVVSLADLYESEARHYADSGPDSLAAHTATQLGHLAHRGHRQIAFALPVEADSDRIVALRLQYARASANGLGVAPPVVLRIGESPQEAAGALSQMLQESSELTAVAGFDDETALRVLAAMADLGLHAPADLAVIGFDDGPFGALWRPALTTIHIEAETFGRRTARAALGLDIGEWATPPSSVIVRSTT